MRIRYRNLGCNKYPFLTTDLTPENFDEGVIEQMCEDDVKIFEIMNKLKEVFKNSEQRFDDKKLEFFTFDSDWNFTNAKMANKLYHGNGPFIINFKETPLKVYLNFLNIYIFYFFINKNSQVTINLIEFI